MEIPQKKSTHYSAIWISQTYRYAGFTCFAAWDRCAKLQPCVNHHFCTIPL